MRMVLAPEPQLSACLAVLRRAITLARNEHGLVEQTTDVMDAVHPIPDLIGDWHDGADAQLRRNLERCDAKWPTGLLATYDFILERRVI
jgi:hypothetical protein